MIYNHQINHKQYFFIMEAEKYLMRFYRINLFEVENQMSILDLQWLIDDLRTDEEQDRQNKTQDKMMKALMNIRDILNYISIPERH